MEALSSVSVVVTPSNLGSAATLPASSFATSEQGSLASSALQPGEAASPEQGLLADTALQPGEALEPASIGTTVQAYSANLQELSGLDPATTGKALLVSETVDNARAVLDPTSQVISGEGLRLTYHKARGAWHVKAFNPSLTAVGAGNSTVDTEALQAAFDAAVPVDITGTSLQANAPIVVNTSGSRIGAVMSMSRNSAKGGRIRIMDAAMEALFDVKKDNFEASNFLIYGDNTITTTIGIRFARTSAEGADIDARVMNMAFDYVGTGILCVGRGLKVADTTFANIQVAGIDLDTPASWVMSGATTDLLTTGMRGYEFSGLRGHALSGPLVRNVGANAKNVRGIILNGALCDIGSGGSSNGGIFKGVAVSGRFSNLNSLLNVNAQGSLVQFDPGSRDTDVVNFECSGFKDADTQRLSYNGIVLTASTADPIKRVKFIGGKLGPVDRQGVILADVATGADIDVTFVGVSWDRAALGGSGSNYFPIFVSTSLNSARVKLSGCDFDGSGVGVVTPPTHVVGGKNSANVTLIRDAATTKTNIANWSQGSVTQVLVAT